MSTTESLSRGLKMTLLSRIVRLVTNGLLMILLTRYLLGPDGYGLLFLTLSVIGVAQLFSDLGLAKSAARYVTEFRKAEESQVPHVLRSSLKLRMLLIGGVSCVLVFTSGVIGRALGEPRLAPFLVVGVVYLAFNSLTTFNTILFQGFNSVSWSAAIQIVNNVGRVTFVVVFVVGIGLGVPGALLGYVAGAVLAACAGFLILYYRFYNDYEPASAPTSGLLRRIFEYSIPLTVTRGASVINGKVDTILIGFFMNPAAVGMYMLGKQIASVTLAPARSLGFTISPTYGEQKVNDELDHAGNLYETTLRYTLLLYVPAAVGLVLVAEPTVRLVFGNDFMGAVPVVQVLSLYVVLQAITGITTDGLDYLGRARARATVKGSTAVANAGLNLVLIPAYGIVGAAIATVLTLGIYTGFNLYIMYQEVPFSFQRLLYPFAVVGGITVCMAGVVFVLLPHVQGLLTLSGVVLIGVLVWGSLALASDLVDCRNVVAFLS